MPDFDANDGFARLPGPAPGRRPAPALNYAAILRYPDVLFVVIAAAVALALGAPALGCVIGAVAWVCQRVLARYGGRLIQGTAQQSRFGLNLVDAFGRIWLLAGAIVLAAVLGGRSDGLAASLMIFAAYSLAFTRRLIDGRPGGPSQ